MKKGAERKEFPSPVLGEGIPRQREGEGLRGRYERPSSAPFAQRLRANLLPEREKGATIVVLFILFCIISVPIFIFLNNKPCAAFNEATLQTPKQIIRLALANTPEKQSKGLGGCKSVPKNSGMYFQFEDSSTQTFWMKDMVIPIDIIWIQDNRVVGIEKNVPSFPPGTPDDALPRYTSPMPVDAVLEVGAGKAEEYGIEIGVTLAIDTE